MRVVKNIQEAAANMTEVKLRRTTHSKTYHISNKTYRTFQTITPIHWIDENDDLRTIDLTPVDKGDHWFIDKAPYTLKVYKDTLDVDYTSDLGGNTKIKLMKIGDVPVTALNIEPIIDDEGITFKNVKPNLDLQLKIGPMGIEWYKVLHNNTVATKFEWEVLEDKDKTTGHRPKAIGKDAGNNHIELINNKEQIDDVLGQNCFKMTEEFTGRIKVVQNNKTRVKSWSTNVTYPVTIDVPDITESVVAAEDGFNDDWASQYYYWGGPGTGSPASTGSISGMAGTYDGYWGRRGFATHKHALHQGYPHFYFVKIYQQNMVFRFTTVAVPVASTIALAELKVYVQSVGGGGITTGTVKGIDEDNVAVNSSGNRWSPKTKTTATTASGTINSTGSKAIDVTTIVQEIVDRAGWANNNAIGMFMSGEDPTGLRPIVSSAATGFTNTGSALNRVQLDLVEAAGTNQAVLEITFETASTTPLINFVGL